MQMPPADYAKIKSNLRRSKEAFVDDEVDARFTGIEMHVWEEYGEDPPPEAFSELAELEEDLVGAELKIPLALRMFWLQVGGVCFADPNLKEGAFLKWMSKYAAEHEMYGLSGYSNPIWVNHPPKDFTRPADCGMQYELEEVEDLYLCAVLSPCWQGKEARRYPDINPGTPQHIVCTQETVIDPAFQYIFVHEEQGCQLLTRHFSPGCASPSCRAAASRVGWADRRPRSSSRSLRTVCSRFECTYWVREGGPGVAIR